MRVELVIEGGIAHFPGLARPIVLDDAHLAGDALADAHRLCRAAIEIGKRQTSTQSPGVPDGRRYRLTIELEGERHQIVATDPVASDAVARLIELIRARGAR